MLGERLSLVERLNVTPDTFAIRKVWLASGIHIARENQKVLPYGDRLHHRNHRLKDFFRGKGDLFIFWDHIVD